jgi:hypothetical protein
MEKLISVTWPWQAGGESRADGLQLVRSFLERRHRQSRVIGLLLCLFMNRQEWLTMLARWSMRREMGDVGGGNISRRRTSGRVAAELG